MKSVRQVIVPAVIGALTLPGTALAEPALGLNSPVRPQLELTTRLTEKLDVRFGLNQRDGEGMALGRHGTADGGGLSASALVDWRMATEGLRLTGGALYGDLGWSHAPGSWRGSMMDYDRDYALWGDDDAEVTPYLGLGWDQELGDGGRLGLQLDLGVMFESFESGTAGASAGPSIEEEALLRQEFENFRYTPMISAGVRYRF